MSIPFHKHQVIVFTSDGGWDTHVKRVISNGRKKVNQLHSIISNRNINLSARRLLLLSSALDLA